jgi:hypothetical protein
VVPMQRDLNLVPLERISARIFFLMPFFLFFGSPEVVFARIGTAFSALICVFMSLFLYFGSPEVCVSQNFSFSPLTVDGIFIFLND